MRYGLQTSSFRRDIVIAAALVAPLLMAPGAASAEGLFDFLFGGAPRHQQPSPAVDSFANPFAPDQQQPVAPKPAAAGGRYAAFCVRSCDGKYFPLLTKAGDASLNVTHADCPL